MPTGATAACFYAALVAGVSAAVVAAGRLVERRPIPRMAFGLAAFAAAGLAVSVVAYATGSRDVLPF